MTTAPAADLPLQGIALGHEITLGEEKSLTSAWGRLCLRQGKRIDAPIREKLPIEAAAEAAAEAAVPEAAPEAAPEDAALAEAAPE